MLSILEEPEIRRQAYAVSVESYHELGRLGLIDERTELLGGVIVTKMSKSPLHQLLVRRLQFLLQASVTPGLYVDREAPITCADSEPEPDLGVFVGDAKAYTTKHAETAELVVEVSINTVRRDRLKSRIYAGAAVKEYWLIEPDARRITVYRQPADGNYAVCETHVEGIVASASVPAFRVALNELFAM
jgi:Uma2 family endonuclease